MGEVMMSVLVTETIK